MILYDYNSRPFDCYDAKWNVLFVQQLQMSKV